VQRLSLDADRAAQSADEQGRDCGTEIPQILAEYHRGRRRRNRRDRQLRPRGRDVNELDSPVPEGALRLGGHRPLGRLEIDPNSSTLPADPDAVLSQRCGGLAGQRERVGLPQVGLVPAVLDPRCEPDLVEQFHHLPCRGIDDLDVA
jgi:hypothetical protein